MFVHSKQFCNNVPNECIQPNAIDVTLDQLFRINTTSSFWLAKNGDKHMRDRYEVFPNHGTDKHQYFEIYPGQYQFEASIGCEIPEGIVGWLVARSTLNRNGIFVYSGLYDSGFKSPTIGGIIYSNCDAKIEKGTRIAQFITAKAETAHLYNGQYQNGKSE